MKLVGAISATVLSLSLGVCIPVFAQQEQHEQQEENKDKAAQGKDERAQPAKQGEKGKQEGNARRQENPQQDSNRKEEQKGQEQHVQETKQGKAQDHARGNGGRIPDRYKANFGRDHRFRVTEANYRDRRFEYGGYSFEFVQPWPSNWLYTQDVYVVEIDGVYYLCNASYPGVNLTLSLNL